MALSFDRTGTVLAIGGEATHTVLQRALVSLWHVQSGLKLRFIFRGEDYAINTLAFQRGGQGAMLAAGGSDRVLRVWDVPDVARWSKEVQLCLARSANDDSTR